MERYPGFMPFTRTSFSDAVDDLFMLAEENVTRDGFTVDIVMGFDTNGVNTVSFVEAATMDARRLADLVPPPAKVISRPLASSSTLIAAAFALHQVTSAVFSGILVTGEGEEFVATIGIWPTRLLVRSHLTPVHVLAGRGEPLAPQTHTWDVDLSETENWLISLIPDV